MRTGLQLRQTQQLSMTPQLQQAIGLLQLSTIELETQLREALESNVMLEETVPTEDNAETSSDAPDERQNEKETELDFDASTTTDVDADWDSAAVESNATGNESGNEASAPMLRDEPQAAASGDLRSHLTWQLALTPMSDIDHAIALTLIDALDDNGYLSESVEALCQNFQSATESAIETDTVTVDEIEAVRHRLQHFDPLGVAATDLADCLAAQLRQFAATTPGLQVANQLVANYLDVLAKGD
ncbi:MAG TPA: RNA polymerase factor sigma-54, partial [Gammaproteobacteria bacterium]|nr:RNA polymerase factor sigma-54 [Gammaproteobacteria bacterium]